MAGQTTKTEAPRADQAPADDLSPAEQAEIRETDTADKARRTSHDLSGKRLRAIPAIITNNGDTGTTVQVRRVDFDSVGIDHDTVTFDQRKDNYTLPVGENGISEKAADYLAKNFPLSFEYMDNGE